LQTVGAGGKGGAGGTGKIIIIEHL
jgi:hypothetical protein